MKFRNAFKVVILSLVLSFVSGCGQPDFGSQSSSDSKPKQSAPPPKNGVTSLTWHNPCPKSKVAPPKAGEAERVILGPGPHRLSQQLLTDGLAVRFSGEICQPDPVPRDVIFVVDVSGSMGPSGVDPGADPVVSGTCGRRKAIEAVMGSAGERGTVQFGVVTFSSQVVASSSKFFADFSELSGDLLRQSNLNELNKIVCAYGGATHYDAALQGAEKLFSNGRPNTQKEIYFISDGVPSPASAHGKEIAQKLKSVGVEVRGVKTLVTIVTTMLGTADDTILRNDIASRDSDNQPLHSKVDRASKLADTMKSMAKNSLEDGDLSFGSKGMKSSKKISLKPHFKNGSYQTEFFNLDNSNSDEGLELWIRFKDKLGASQDLRGLVEWE